MGHEQTFTATHALHFTDTTCSTELLKSLHCTKYTHIMVYFKVETPHCKQSTPFICSQPLFGAMNFEEYYKL